MPLILIGGVALVLGVAGGLAISDGAEKLTRLATIGTIATVAVVFRDEIKGALK